ncbi:WhiB family transcriptional regulator [Mycolicibacterium helvum]|uniref:WhiB family transcriptional regulator n=1 Tax=Mycolicibacterium helvum TaxID=1534349 RepID=UPI0013D3B799|nr:WhiB family transcriptional regulator [Mycolicibacterium helvum]
MTPAALLAATVPQYPDGTQARPPGHVRDPSADWRDAARCRNEDPELFFHPDGERAGRRRSRLSRARAVCEACPVIRECGAYALAFREGFGVWGGMSEEELVARIVAAGGRPRGRAVHLARSSPQGGTGYWAQPE